jgi:hypothetical protein
MNAQIAMAAKAHLVVAAHGIPIGGTWGSDINQVKMVGLFGHRRSPFS